MRNTQPPLARALPLVSICLPVYDALDTIEASIESALAQTYPAMEIIVVDDASTDGTFARLEHLHDPRIRLFRHRRNHGPPDTWNATIIHSKGDYIKFLHHDDLLDAECVARMASALDTHPSAGLVFARRRLIGGSGPFVNGWADAFRKPHESLLPLDELTTGRELLTRWWRRNEMRHNSIGEPVAVMVRRTALEHGGLFHRHMRQGLDMELWIRIFARADGVFIDEDLASYRPPTSSSLTAQNLFTNRSWVDRAWILETAVSADLRPEDHAEAVALLEHERRVVLRTCGSMLLRRTTGLPYSPALAYLWCLALRRTTGSRRRLHDSL